MKTIIIMQRYLSMLRYEYTLTTEGKRRCTNDEFYLQNTSGYRGYTEKIFRLLHMSEKPLTIKEISKMTGISSHSINGVLTFNISVGYITRQRTATM